MDPDQPQHDSPVARIIAQQYSPATLPFIPARKNSGGTWKFIILIFRFKKKFAHVWIWKCVSVGVPVI